MRSPSSAGPGGTFHRPILLAAAVLLAAVAALSGGCSRKPEAARGILLVSIDTLRADHLGCYGYGRPTSPLIDAFAAKGTLFETATAQAPWTLPSHAVMLTGLFPHRTGVVDESRKLPGDVPTLASILEGRGFITGAVVNSHWLGPEQGLDKGFLTFESFPETINDAGRLLIVDRGAEITDRAIAWLERYGGKPFFLFVHYYDVHSSYDPDPAFRKLFERPYAGRADGGTGQLMAVRDGKLRYDAADTAHIVDLYDGEIRQLDGQIGRLLAKIRDLGLGRTTCVAITADHGEEFMEHGGVLHGRTLYEEVLRVPLVVRGPGVPAGRRVKETAMTADIVPTLLGLAGIAPPAACDGRNLFSSLPPAGGKSPGRPAFAEGDWRNEEPDILRMVRQGRFKLIYNRLTKSRELYDLAADPGEKTDIALRRPSLAAELMKRLETFLEGRREADRIAPRPREELERLKRLGYF